MTKFEGEVSLELLKPKPKIFLYTADFPDGDGVAGYALAEDGSSLYATTVRNALYAKADLTHMLAIRLYDAHYPDGYELVELFHKPDEELDAIPEFVAALRLNHELSSRDPQTPGIDKKPV